MDKKLDVIIELQKSKKEAAFSCFSTSQSGAASQPVDKLFEPRALSQRDRGSRRITRAEQVDLANQQVYLIPLSEHQNITELWHEYKNGPNPLKLAVEKSGGACFDYGSTKKRWSEQRLLYKFVETRIAQGFSERDAISALQCELDKFPRTRKKNSGKANWKALLRSVAKMPESQEHKKRKRNSTSSSCSEIPSESLIIEFRRDGSVRETEPCALPFDTHISVAPARAAGNISLAVGGAVARPYTGFAL